MLEQRIVRQPPRCAATGERCGHLITRQRHRDLPSRHTNHQLRRGPGRSDQGAHRERTGGERVRVRTTHGGSRARRRCRMARPSPAIRRASGRCALVDQRPGASGRSQGVHLLGFVQQTGDVQPPVESERTCCVACERPVEQELEHCPTVNGDENSTAVERVQAAFIRFEHARQSPALVGLISHDSRHLQNDDSYARVNVALAVGGTARLPESAHTFGERNCLTRLSSRAIRAKSACGRCASYIAGASTAVPHTAPPVRSGVSDALAHGGCGE